MRLVGGWRRADLGRLRQRIPRFLLLWGRSPKDDLIPMRPLWKVHVMPGPSAYIFAPVGKFSMVGFSMSRRVLKIHAYTRL